MEGVLSWPRPRGHFDYSSSRIPCSAQYHVRLVCRFRVSSHIRDLFFRPPGPRTRVRCYALQGTLPSACCPPALRSMLMCLGAQKNKISMQKSYNRMTTGGNKVRNPKTSSPRVLSMKPVQLDLIPITSGIIPGHIRPEAAVWVHVPSTPRARRTCARASQPCGHFISIIHLAASVVLHTRISCFGLYRARNCQILVNSCSLAMINGNFQCTHSYTTRILSYTHESYTRAMEQ